ncbi:FabD/lysophospholipase-like protein, partial [Flagelloscypha sp. PMI_526]
LDGGAFLVLSELFILREIMARLGNVLNLETMPLPSDHFDLIGGAGAGGRFSILAILLGRLRMSVDAVIEHFIRLYQALYQSGLDKTGRSLKLAEYFQNLVQDVTMAESKPSCNVFVCAMPAVAVTGSKPSLFRNYVARRFASFDCKIWEAARATTADHSHFEVISIGPTWSPEEYVDPGAFGLSNPIDSVVEEAKSLFPSGQEMLLLSLGAGHPGVFSFHANSDELVPLHKTISEDCERTAHRMEGREYEGYFRFNVAQGFQGIGLLELTKPGIIAGHTKQYLHSVDVDHRVDNVVSFLEKRHRQCAFLRPLFFGTSLTTDPASSRTLTQDDTSTATLLPQVAPLPQEHLTTFFSSPSIVPFTTAQPIQAYMYELYEAGHGLRE